MVVQADDPSTFAQPLRGLWIDHWTEVVPVARKRPRSRSSTTRPMRVHRKRAARVPPVPDEDWTIGALHRVLAETLDLAKLRAVDSDALADCGQFLPALCFAFNAKDDAVSTDFAPLTR